MGDSVFNAADAMDASKDVPAKETVVQQSVISLSRTVCNFLHKGIELTRICRLAVLLKESGMNPNAILYRELAEKCIDSQRDDGGWTDVTETIWCVSLLNFFDEFSSFVGKALQWLENQRGADGGWGKSKRDTARIPVTGLLLYLLPQLSSDQDIKWLENKWYQELEVEPCLTYKAAFTLMAFRRNGYLPMNQDLIAETIHWLCDQQNDDKGWGPWKGHPVGSDPWCTAIGTIGLLQYPDKSPQKVLSNGLKWLEEKQLPNGLWPYHYIDDGSSWALYALTMGYSLLTGKRN